MLGLGIHILPRAVGSGMCFAAKQTMRMSPGASASMGRKASRLFVLHALRAYWRSDAAA